MTRRQALFALSAAFSAAVLAITPSHPRASNLESAPISLTNPDGQSLALVKYDLRAAVHGALSLVEMELTFRNPESRQMEGRFSYTLPPDATISRFAKEVNGKLMEGEVVERQRAQAIYTEILHTMRDPALLEMDQGNRFSARVFPVPANGTVRLLLSFSQSLPMKDGVRTLRIPLAGLPKIGEFNFNATGHTLDSETGAGTILDKEESFSDDLSTVSRHAVDFTPTKDIELHFTASSDKPIHTLKAGNFQMVQFLYNPVDAPKIAAPTDWSFYFDTSASSADIEAPRLQILDRLLLELVPVLRENDKVFSASAFDVEMSSLLSAVSMSRTDGGRPVMPELVHKLRSRHALGATNLEAALKQIGDTARGSAKPATYVLVSDGIATWGKREVNDLLVALGDWPAKDTLHALVIGSKQDSKTLNAIVEKTHGRIVTVPLNGDVNGIAVKALAELRAPLGAHFEAYDEGTAWIFPKSFHDVRPGTELIAYSEIKPGAKSLPGFAQRAADGKLLKDTQITLAPVEVADFAPLLQRQAYAAYLDFLERQEQAETDAMKRAEWHKKRIDISVKNRVMCPLTSLLVLETERDYARFGIARNALADVLAIGENGIELLKRSGDDLLLVTKSEEKAFGGKDLAKRKADKAGADRDGAENEAIEHAPHDSPLAGRSLRGREPGFERGEQLEVAKQAVDAVQSLSAASPGSGAGHNGLPRPVAAAPLEAPAAEAQSRRAPATENAGEARANGALQQPSAGAKPVRPDWIGQADEIPSDEMLNELRSKIGNDPHDRKLRNNYADALLKAKKYDNLQAEVFQWLPFDPENPAVYEYLGKSATALNDPALALRAYSSIAEIAPNRAALLSRAGFLLLAAKKYDVAETMFREALKNRKDDCNIHRGLAMTLWLRGDFEGASVAYETALMQEFNARYGDAKRVLREEFGYVLRAWQQQDPTRSNAIVARALRANVDLLRTDALRVTMCWETDANDVDLHVVDPQGEECFYQHTKNASGLELYSDQTQGLGPEVIRTERAQTGTYQIGVNYFSAGPMGVSRGIVVVLKPANGIDNTPQIIPFALIEGGKDMRYVGSVTY